MLTGSKIQSGTRSRGGLVVALALAATFAVYLDADGQKAPDDFALLDQHSIRASPLENFQSAADVQPVDSVEVGANLSRSEPWPEFGQSEADAAAPSCLDAHEAQHALFMPDDLLRMPFLVSEAADHACR